jgi:hypothetical protein
METAGEATGGQKQTLTRGPRRTPPSQCGHVQGSNEFERAERLSAATFPRSTRTPSSTASSFIGSTIGLQKPFVSVPDSAALDIANFWVRERCPARPSHPAPAFLGTQAGFAAEPNGL